MTGTPCAAVVWQLVPYLDARFSAAAERLDLTVVEAVGQAATQSWSRDVKRNFKHVAAAGGAGGQATPETWNGLVRELDKLTPATVAIQGWSDPAALTTAQWAIRNQARIVVLSESNSYDHKRSWTAEWGKARVLGVCDAALVGGRDHVAYLAELGFDPSRVALGYNVIDNAHFAPLAGATPVGPARPYFLVASRLVEVKNVERAIRCYAAYREAAGPEAWDLKILGVGPLESRLREVIADLDVGSSVELCGFRKYDELPAFYHAAGALLHVALEEPWGLVVNEAMAAGLPIIISNRVGSCCELVRDGVNGLVVAPTADADITRAMVALAGGAVDRAAFGRSSLRIIANWGPARFGQGFREAYDIAQQARARNGVLDRLTVRALAHGKAMAALTAATRSLRVPDVGASGGQRFAQRPSTGLKRGISTQVEPASEKPD